MSILLKSTAADYEMRETLCLTEGPRLSGIVAPDTSSLKSHTR